MKDIEDQMPSPTRSATPQPQLAEDRRPALWSTPADDERARLARKSYAQKIAITVAQSVKDRHQRAELKTEFYNRLISFLEEQATRRQILERLYRKTLLGLTGCLAIAVAIIAVLITWF